MSFPAFDARKTDEYAARAKAEWGGTEAYRAYEQKSRTRSPQESRALADGLTDLFRQFGCLKHLPAESTEVQTLVAQLQAYISAHYYPCTDEIFSGLGRLYAASAEFTENIDGAGGAGTAAFVSQAIRIFCAGK